MSAVHLHLVDKSPKPSTGEKAKKADARTKPLPGTTKAKKETAKNGAASKETTKKAKGSKGAKVATADAPVATASKKASKAVKAKKHEATVADVMSSPALCVREGEGLHDAVRLMWDHDVGAVVVVNDEDKPVGMVTDRDACMAAHTQGVALYDGSLSSAMSNTLVSCRIGTTISEVRTVMAKAQVRRVPVVNDEGRLVGVVALSDLVKEASATPPGDRKRGSTGAALVALFEAMLRPTESA